MAIAIAKHYNTVILSADSRQFYKETSIGTAKPSAAELDAVPHFFIGNRSIHEAYNVGMYEEEALACLQTQFQQHEKVVMVGGSGLYINALCNGIDELPEADWDLREQLHQLHAEKGIEALQEQLQQLDPVFYAQVDTQNPQRLMRALEVCLVSGKPYSSFRNQQPKERPFRIIKLGLTMDRAALYARIDKRVEQMMEQGLLAEATALYPHCHLNALHTMGYTELFDYMDGKHSLEEAIALIQQNSRRYAKRQLTWFRRDAAIQWFQPEQLEEMIGYCTQLENK